MSEPSDKMGEVDAPPWAGIWLEDFDAWAEGEQGHVVGHIVVIQPDFTVELFHYDSNQEMREAWEAFEQTIEKEPHD